jgi:hypothetical protein
MRKTPGRRRRIRGAGPFSVVHFGERRSLSRQRPCHAKSKVDRKPIHFRGARVLNESRSPAASTIQAPSRSKSRGVENLLTLKQACSSEHRGAQGAFKDSMIHCRSAIHITYRDSLRSSSMREPRDPLLKVVITFVSKNRVS